MMNIDTFDLIKITKVGEAAAILAKIIEFKNLDNIEAIDKEIEKFPAELSSSIADVKKCVLRSTIIYISKNIGDDNLTKLVQNDTDEKLPKEWESFLSSFDKRERVYSFMEYKYKLSCASLLSALSAKKYKDDIVKCAIDDFVEKVFIAIKEYFLEVTADQFPSDFPIWMPTDPRPKHIHDIWNRNMFK